MQKIGRGRKVVIGLAVCLATIVAAFFIGCYYGRTDATSSAIQVSSRDRRRWLNNSLKLNELVGKRLASCPHYRLNFAASQMLLYGEIEQPNPHVLSATLHQARPNTKGIDFILNFSAFSLNRELNELVFLILADDKVFVIRYEIDFSVDSSGKDDRPYLTLPFYGRKISLEELDSLATVSRAGVPCLILERFSTNSRMANPIPLPIEASDAIIGVAVVDKTQGISSFVHIDTTEYRKLHLAQ